MSDLVSPQPAPPSETALSLPSSLPPSKPDAEASSAAVTAHVAENHGGTGSERVKSIVFGGLDGVITTFSIVAAVAGASLPIETALRECKPGPGPQ